MWILKKNPDFVEKIMFSNLKIEKMEDRPCDVLIDRAENPRVKQLEKKSRFAIDKDGVLLSKTRVYNVRDGIFEAILDKFYTDPTLISYGEDLRDWGGTFRGITADSRNRCLIIASSIRPFPKRPWSARASVMAWPAGVQWWS